LWNCNRTGRRQSCTAAHAIGACAAHPAPLIPRGARIPVQGTPSGAKTTRRGHPFRRCAPIFRTKGFRPLQARALFKAPLPRHAHGKCWLERRRTTEAARGAHSCSAAAASAGSNGSAPLQTQPKASAFISLRDNVAVISRWNSRPPGEALYAPKMPACVPHPDSILRPVPQIAQDSVLCRCIGSAGRGLAWEISKSTRRWRYIRPSESPCHRLAAFRHSGPDILLPFGAAVSAS